MEAEQDVGLPEAPLVPRKASGLSSVLSEDTAWCGLTRVTQLERRAGLELLRTCDFSSVESPTQCITSHVAGKEKPSYRTKMMLFVFFFFIWTVLFIYFCYCL
jgi:hypothetical protein